MNDKLGMNESVSVQEKQAINTDMGRGVTNMSNQTETDTERTELVQKLKNIETNELTEYKDYPYRIYGYKQIRFVEPIGITQERGELLVSTKLVMNQGFKNYRYIDDLDLYELRLTSEYIDEAVEEIKKEIEGGDE